MDLHTILPALKIPSDVVGAADGLSRASGQTLEAQVLFCFGRSGCLQWVPLDLCAHGSTRGILGYAQNFRSSLTRYCFSKRDVQLRYAGSISDGLMAGPFAAGFLGRHMFRLYDMPCSMDVDALDGLHAADKAGSHADYTERVLEGGLIGEYFQSARWNRSNYGFGHGLIIARHIARFFAWKYQRPQAPNELPLGFLRGFKQGFSEANLMESRSNNFTSQQMMSIKGTLSDCIHQAVEEWNARVSAGPKTYQQVATVTPLHTLSKGMQDVISQLCTAVNSEKTRAPYLRRFAHHVIFDE